MQREKRICILYSALLLCLWLLCVKLYLLSSGQDNKALTVLDGQYSSRLVIAQRSGFIYDRYFELLSHDECTGILTVNPSEITNLQEVSLEISKNTPNFAQSEILEKIHVGSPFKVTVKDNNSAIRLCKKYSGLYYTAAFDENNSLARHFLGYSRENKGITGLRGYYSTFLYNKLSSQSDVVFTRNAINQSMSPLKINDRSYNSTDGIITTLDKKLQTFCDSLEADIKSGCVVVADSENGEILALSSFPSYDVQNLSLYLDSQKGELLNRVLYSYTPGSIFKIIVSAAALEKDSGYIDFTHTCSGSIQADDHVLKCHLSQGHGTLSMKDAFALSCNCYYVALAKEIGLKKIVETAKITGLDKASQADFLKEATHSFPDFENLSDGYLANISIGQGDLCVSPLDMINVMICAVTGYRTFPRAILGAVQNGKGIYTEPPVKTRVFSKNTADLLCNMMEECVNTGTGKSGKIEDVRMGGKTATAQTGRFDPNGVEYVHKWFCGYYEGIGKTYIFCILCDNTPENKLSPAVVSGKLCSFLKENMY